MTQLCHRWHRREYEVAVDDDGWQRDDAKFNRMIELTSTEYERIRGHPRRFIVLPGHELPEIEEVVETADGYVVVEKRGAAGRHAAAEDPRG